MQGALDLVRAGEQQQPAAALLEAFVDLQQAVHPDGVDRGQASEIDDDLDRAGGHGAAAGGAKDRGLVLIERPRRQQEVDRRLLQLAYHERSGLIRATEPTHQRVNLNSRSR